MAVKLELYRVFKEVAETGNISVAARNLYISQSAVSQSIKQLETALQARERTSSPRPSSCCWVRWSSAPATRSPAFSSPHTWRPSTGCIRASG